MKNAPKIFIVLVTIAVSAYLVFLLGIFQRAEKVEKLYSMTHSSLDCGDGPLYSTVFLEKTFLIRLKDGAEQLRQEYNRNEHLRRQMSFYATSLYKDDIINYSSYKLMQNKIGKLELRNKELLDRFQSCKDYAEKKDADMELRLHAEDFSDH